MNHNEAMPIANLSKNDGFLSAEETVGEGGRAMGSVRGRGKPFFVAGGEPAEKGG